MMNYQYIEQLLERYWQGETNLDEEQILRSFFCQEDVPAQLRQYSDYFAYVKASKEETVSADFDSRFADILDSEQSAAPVVRAKAIHIPFKSRLMPFLKAAAVVAVTLTVGGAALKGLMQDEELEYGQLTSGTYVQSDDVKQVIETAHKTLTAKADSLSEENAVGKDIKTE